MDPHLDDPQGDRAPRAPGHLGRAAIGLTAGPPAPDEFDIVNDFDSFYEAQYQSLYRTIRGIVLEPSLAEDLTQDAFAKAYAARERYRPDQPPGAWLHRIAVNTAISHARRGQLGRRILEKVGRGQATVSADPTETHDHALVEALRALSPAQRATVVLHFYHGYSYAEIGGILGIPSGTVGSRISVALASLRKRLAAGAEEERPAERLSSG
ncbi:MAG: RNA polymerase sigma factor [Candidatus Dormibacteria bacterium]